MTKAIVAIQNGQPMTNSRDVAELFGKRHDNVRRDIRTMIDEVPACALNFEETWQEVVMPRGGSRQSKTFNMTKDGFVLLAMGFTGKEALRFKLAYIARFNEMEAELRKPLAPSSLASQPMVSFDFAGLELRVIMHMGEPLFLLADVCKVLDLRSNNGSYTHHLRKLSAHQFTSTSNVEVSGLGIRGVPKLVTEAGLYKLISRSRKPEAVHFQDWVFDDVLPAIRKTGGYLLNEEARETANADDRHAMPLPEQSREFNALA